MAIAYIDGFQIETSIGPSVAVVQSLREKGWVIIDGKITNDGQAYIPVRQNQKGYAQTIVEQEGLVEIGTGGPGWFAQVAYKE
jgi:hypothetical protein